MSGDDLPFILAIFAIAAIFIAASCAEQENITPSVKECAGIEDPEVAKACFDAVGRE